MRRTVPAAILLALLTTLLLPAAALCAPQRTVAAGAFHSLWIADDGVLWGTGYNAGGALGDGTYVQRNLPGAVGCFDDWRQCAAGYYTSYGIRANGSLWAWGANDRGQLGIGTTAKKAAPTRVGAPAVFTSVAAGAWHALALRADGSLWAWGENERGQLGTGTTADSKTPVQVGGATDWVAVSAYGNNSAARKADGSWWIWGAGNDGQIGLGTTADQRQPRVVAGPGVADELYVGGYQTFARWAPGTASAGRLTSAGRNQWGQLGRGTFDPQNNPVPTFAAVAGAAVVADVGPGWHHTLALTPDGHVLAWGRGDQGQIGNGATLLVNATPGAVGIDGVTAVAAGEEFSLARRGDATIWGWGSDKNGQLGLAGAYVHASPAFVASLRIAFLGRPDAPTKVRAGRKLTARGIMLPNHTGPVKVALYRKSGGTWKLVKTVSAKVTKTTSGARWTISYTPTKSGSWYLRASHKDAAHLMSLSPKHLFSVAR